MYSISMYAVSLILLILAHTHTHAIHANAHRLHIFTSVILCNTSILPTCELDLATSFYDYLAATHAATLKLVDVNLCTVLIGKTLK